MHASLPTCTISNQNQIILSFVYIFVFQSGELIDSIRNFASFGDTKPLVVVLDIPNQKKFVLEKDSYTSDDIKDIVGKLKTESLETQSLRPDED